MPSKPAKSASILSTGHYLFNKASFYPNEVSAGLRLRDLKALGFKRRDQFVHGVQVQHVHQLRAIRLARSAYEAMAVLIACIISAHPEGVLRWIGGHD